MEFYDVPYIGNFIIPTDELIFFRGVGIPPTRYYCIYRIIVDDEHPYIYIYIYIMIIIIYIYNIPSINAFIIIKIPILPRYGLVYVVLFFWDECVVNAMS